MQNIAIYSAPKITLTRDAYYSGLWYLYGWTITPDSISHRTSYNGNNCSKISGTEIVTPFAKIVREDTSGSDAYLQFWSTSNDLHASLYMNYDDNYFMLYSWNHGIGIGAANNSSKLYGTWYGTVTKESSRIVKKDIEALNDKHSVLFDNLIPRSFKYIDGNSGRTHYGYIVDELKSAMDRAKLSSEECAAYCLMDIEKPDGEGGIRYDELAVLTTREVQSLKQRVKQIEKFLLSIKEE